MVDFTDQDLIRLDAQFAEEDIPFHARPLAAAEAILKSGFNFHDPRLKAICDAYEKLFPETRSTWPGMGTGLVASVDRVRVVTTSVIFGQVNLTPSSALGFSDDQEWIAWCRGEPRIQIQSTFAFADIYDFAYAVDDLRSYEDTKAFTLWCNAAAQLATTASHLASSGNPGDAVLQTIGLAAELAIKGSLLHLGMTEKELSYKPYGHNYVALAEKLIELRPHRDDPVVLHCLQQLPDYVQSRYNSSNLSRLQIIQLALGTQFVAASAVRRIATRDIAGQVEQHFGPRARHLN